MTKRFAILVLSFVILACAAAASAQTLQVTADRTNLRDKPSTDGAIVVALSMGQELEVIDQSGMWYHVRVTATGAQGYVSSLVVRVVQGNAAPARPAAAPSPAAPAAAPPAAPAQGQTVAAAPGGGFADRKYFIRVFGGIWSGYSATGLGAGGGIATRPFSLPELELEIDVAYAHQKFNDIVVGPYAYGWSASLIQGSGNVLYNFKLPNLSFTPFAGAGLEYSHQSFNFSDSVFRYETSGIGFDGIGFQLIGGIEKPLNDKTAFRAQFRAGNGVLLLAGLSF